MTEIPCEECISLAICKSRAKEYGHFGFAHMIDCKRIIEYLSFDLSMRIYKKRYNNFVDFMGLYEITKFYIPDDYPENFL